MNRYIHESYSDASRYLQIYYNYTYHVRLTSADDRMLELLTTLSPLEPLKRHHDVKLPRAEYTGTWLLQLESFCKWQDGNITVDNSSVFCCYGIPGAGKTMIWYWLKSSILS